MIYQISKPVEENLGNRFEHVIWGIRFKGRNAIDASGVTNDAITLSVNSFLYPKTGICIISPNITDNTPSIVNSSNIFHFAVRFIAFVFIINQHLLKIIISL
ncbi:hypothetical protein M9Y10_000494 [Tritrichomonas musculus]|uniref:Uncharacterized protein n=1 Tax=Tritrichomonas musculus TaxID=1915356 RepID=A0ABR2L634_9EUKA